MELLDALTCLVKSWQKKVCQNAAQCFSYFGWHGLCVQLFQGSRCFLGRGWCNLEEKFSDFQQYPQQMFHLHHAWCICPKQSMFFSAFVHSARSSSTSLLCLPQVTASPLSVCFILPFVYDQFSHPSALGRLIQPVSGPSSMLGECLLHAEFIPQCLSFGSAHPYPVTSLP